MEPDLKWAVSELVLLLDNQVIRDLTLPKSHFATLRLLVISPLVVAERL